MWGSSSSHRKPYKTVLRQTRDLPSGQSMGKNEMVNNTPAAEDRETHGESRVALYDVLFRFAVTKYVGSLQPSVLSGYIHQLIHRPIAV